jgi:hypothetical protein
MGIATNLLKDLEGTRSSHLDVIDSAAVEGYDPHIAEGMEVNNKFDL